MGPTTQQGGRAPQSTTRRLDGRPNAIGLEEVGRGERQSAMYWIAVSQYLVHACSCLSRYRTAPRAPASALISPPAWAKRDAINSCQRKCAGQMDTIPAQSHIAQFLPTPTIGGDPPHFPPPTLVCKIPDSCGCGQHEITNRRQIVCIRK